jgi:hypothetical protein
MGRCIWQRCPTENAKEDQIEKHYRNIEDGYVNLVSNLWVGYFFCVFGLLYSMLCFYRFRITRNLWRALPRSRTNFVNKKSVLWN